MTAAAPTPDLPSTAACAEASSSPPSDAVASVTRNSTPMATKSAPETTWNQVVVNGPIASRRGRARSPRRRRSQATASTSSGTTMPSAKNASSTAP